MKQNIQCIASDLFTDKMESDENGDGWQQVRVGQGFWVYGIQGLFKSGIRYIAA